MVTIPGIVVARSIISHAKKVNSGIRVVARISDPDFFNVFRELDVVDLIYPEFEAGLEMTRQVLLHLRIPVPEIQLIQKIFVTSSSQTRQPLEKVTGLLAR